MFLHNCANANGVWKEQKASPFLAWVFIFDKIVDKNF
jgi:hypothetical protein